eukprot:SAG22_NODE_337_length_12043_cov_58.339556_2_plen_47_part_00
MSRRGREGVICEAVSIAAIKGDVPTILRLGGPKNAEMIAASEEDLQ